MCDQIGINAPLHQRLCQLQTEALSLHAPGHKQGRRGSELLTGWLPDAVRFDLTEIADLDSIYQPTGSLLQAEQLTAKLYSAKSTFFTTNGSTAGLIGSLLSAAAPGSELLLPRNAHLSILSAIILGDLLPRFVQPEYLGGHLLGLTKEQLKEGLRSYPAVQTVLLVSPSYQGVVGEISQLVSMAQAADCLVVVDEAHGAHLPFHPSLPPSATVTGADLVVQSAHKTLSALTGGAWVHRLTDSLTDERVRSCLSLVQSTSPSWLILGSLDLARLELAESGQARLTAVLQNAEHLRLALTAAGWSVWDAPARSGYRQDPLKISLLGTPNGFTGLELAEQLQLFGIHPEMVQHDGVLLMLGLGDIESRYEPLHQCLRSLPKRQALSPFEVDVPPLPQLLMRPREAHFSRRRLVELSQAVGRIAARPLFVYPPGVPLIYPGEAFDQEMISYAQTILDRGGDLVGKKGDQVTVVE